MTLRWVWSALAGETPHRQDVRDRFLALPELPEAARMQTRPTVAPKPKPKTIAEWTRQHGRKRA